MPASLEYAVRPSSSPSPHGTTIIASTPGATRARATLTWGAKATMPALGAAINVACCNDDLSELSREGETVRITQKDNPDNYIDVFRANSLSLDKKSKDKCAAGSDQFSGTSDFANLGFAGSFDPAPEDQPKTCKVTWKLNNNTTGA